jgi:hypothetical protein
MSEKMTEQLPVRLTKAQRDFLQKQARDLNAQGLPGRVTEGDIMRALINSAMQAHVCECSDDLVGARA